MVNMLYIIPKGTFPSACRGCGKTVYWVKLVDGTSIPVERPKGISHWKVCKRITELRSGPEEEKDKA